MKSNFSHGQARIFFSIVTIALISGFGAAAKDKLPHPQFACAMRKGVKSERGTGIREKRICNVQTLPKEKASGYREADIRCKAVAKNNGGETAFVKSVSFSELPRFLQERTNQKKTAAVYSNGSDILVLHEPKDESQYFEADGYVGNMDRIQQEIDKSEDGFLPDGLETSSYDCILLNPITEEDLAPGVG